MLTLLRTRRSMGLLTAAGAVAAIDWTTKALATVTLDDRPIDIGSFITLRLSHNTGVAFGAGDHLSGGMVIALTAAVTVALAAAAVRGVFGSPVGAGLLLGGAVANLGDRVLGHSVVDFLDLGWWPSFNLADVALCVGCLVLVVASWRAPEPDAGQVASDDARQESSAP